MCRKYEENDENDNYIAVLNLSTDKVEKVAVGGGPAQVYIKMIL
jgi:DNA-binding beta-propeller fold protein YncE